MMKSMILICVLGLSIISGATENRSASGYYNKSCLEYKQGNMLGALLDNRRAALYEPLDRDNNFNLPLIQKSFIEQNDLDIPPLILLIGWLSWPWLWCASSGVFLLYLIFISTFPNRFRTTKWGLFLLFILLLGNISFRSLLILNDHQMVVSSQRVSINSGPDKQYPILYWVHQGLMGKQVGHRQGWSLIRLPNGDEGWIEDKDQIILKSMGE